MRQGLSQQWEQEVAHPLQCSEVVLLPSKWLCHTKRWLSLGNWHGISSCLRDDGKEMWSCPGPCADGKPPEKC